MEIQKKFAKLTWRKRSMQLHVNEVAFRGDSSLPEEVKQLKTPLQLFLHYFDEPLLQFIAECTNNAARAKDINTSFSVTAVDIGQYLGVLIFMSIIQYPSLEWYWGKHGFKPITSVMKWKRFDAIKKNICFHDESLRKKKGEEGYDPLFRIRKLINDLNEKFDSIPKNARLCVDEQMCATKAKHHLRQYLPNKPHKWGIKLFVLCDSSGYAYQFEVYNGAGDNVILPGTPDLGATGNVVVRLTQTVPDFKHHIVYFDNYYTCVQLLVYLRSRGIYSLGTVKANRIPNSKLPADNQLKDKERGFSCEFVTSAKGVNVSAIAWKDNKIVRLLSTYVGIKPFSRTNAEQQQPAKAIRYERKVKSFLEIDCPQIIREYNAHMGGVDLMDGLMGRYHIRTKTMNMIMRIFYHLIDMACTNAFILHRRILAEKRMDPDCDEELNNIELPNFRMGIAEGLVAPELFKKRVGRPPSRIGTPTEEVSLPRLKTGQRAVHPAPEVRYDLIEHFPMQMAKNERKKKCKMHPCKSETKTFCVKCGVNLCYGEKNCFWNYHHEE